MFRAGDKVIMNGKYDVAEHNKGRIFTVIEEPQPDLMGYGLPSTREKLTM